MYNNGGDTFTSISFDPDNLKQQVVSWLQGTNKYSSTLDAFKRATADEINTLIGIYQDNMGYPDVNI